MQTMIRAGILFAIIVAGVAYTSPSAQASFHFAQINEVMVGFDGDATVQFVEIKQIEGGQNLVNGSRLTAFDSTGGSPIVLLTVSGNVSSTAAGSTWLMATPAFQMKTGVAPDKLIPMPGLPPEGGMICWGIPGNPAIPSQYVDCVAYDPFTGTTQPNPYPPDEDELVSDCQRSSTRVLDRVFLPVPSVPHNNTDFTLAAATPEKDNGTTVSMPFTDLPDSDGIANCRDTDDDNDTHPDTADNCPQVVNTSQLDGDGDLLGSACDPDDAVPDFDGDGCADGEEEPLVNDDPATGGDRSALDPNDFFDTIDGSGTTRDKGIDLSDILDVLDKYGAAAGAVNGLGILVDRNNPDPLKPWRSVAAADGVDLTDILANLTQYGHSCQMPP